MCDRSERQFAAPIPHPSRSPEAASPAADAAARIRPRSRRRPSQGTRPVSARTCHVITSTTSELMYPSGTVAQQKAASLQPDIHRQRRGDRREVGKSNEKPVDGADDQRRRRTSRRIPPRSSSPAGRHSRKTRRPRPGSPPADLPTGRSRPTGSRWSARAR